MFDVLLDGLDQSVGDVLSALLALLLEASEGHGGASTIT
jgi:hypothetical protein